MTITVETIKDWKVRERAHYNGGKEWFGYGYQGIENPRLYRIDRYQRATRSVESEFQVDGVECASLEDCAERLNHPPELRDDERDMLAIIQPGFVSRSVLKELDEYASFDNPIATMHWLDRKGMIEWQNGHVRLTTAGRLYKLGLEESNASGTPNWEAVSKRVNAERAQIARAAGEA